jgi:hypothetical protein
MKRMLMSVVVGLVSFFSSVSSARCEDLINDAYQWASQTDGRYSYRVGFTMSSMKAPAKFVHYSEGAFNLINGMLRAERVAASFSDRGWCPENRPGGFCFPYQKFDHRNQDVMTFNLQRSGVLQVVLNTWGNATYSINLQCSNGFLYGSMVEPNGNSFVTLNLNKSRVEIPR